MGKPNLLEAKKRMQDCLDELGVLLKVCWIPDPNRSVHGEIKGDTLFIYDSDISDVWSTLTHEIVEHKLKDVTQVYRTLLNLMIEGYERLAYQRKENFIESLPRILEVIQKVKSSYGNDKEVIGTGKRELSRIKPPRKGDCVGCGKKLKIGELEMCSDCAASCCYPEC